MVSLIDLAPMSGEVTIRGQQVTVVGITSENIANILYRFPEIRMMLVRIDPGANVFEQLLARIPEAVALVVAASVGADLTASDDKGKETAEAMVQAAARLTVGEQYMIVEKMLEMTFPQGMTRFLAGVQGLLGQAEDARGRAPAMRSPAQSSSASSTEETSDSAGDQPQGS